MFRCTYLLVLSVYNLGTWGCTAYLPLILHADGVANKNILNAINTEKEESTHSK